jgi:hypothetical protein
MNKDDDVSESLKAFATKSKEELQTARRGAKAALRLVNGAGIAIIFFMLMWPGWLLITAGVITIWFIANFAVGIQLVLKHVNMHLETKR